MRQEVPLQETGSLEDLFEEILQELSKLGLEFEDAKRSIENLRERLHNERLHLAVLGQFKRGKSTFINALLGEEILPVGVLPLTALPVFLSFASQPRAQVLLESGVEAWSGKDPKALREFLSQFVTETENPENRKGVLQVEVFYPSPLLQHGVVLIDTPGIGSTLRHNTEITLSFLPQCDAALFLVSADPPITEVEVEFLQAVRFRVTRLFFVLNKIDYLSEADIASVHAFLKEVLRKKVNLENPLIFLVSAQMALEGQKRGDEALLERSGIRKVLQHLFGFLQKEKSRALQEALARKATETLNDLSMHLHLCIRSLEMPIHDLDERLRTFSEKVTEAERERIHLGDLLLGEKKRAVTFLEEWAENLRRRAREHLQGILEEHLAKGTEDLKTRIQEVLDAEVPAFFEHELSRAVCVFEAKVTEALKPYEQRVQELTEAVRKKAAELFDIPFYASKGPEIFAVEKKPYWVTHKWYTRFHILPEGFLATFLPEKTRRAKLRQRMEKEIEELVTTNVENLRWATLQNLDQTFRQFVATIDEHLERTVSATQGAIERARSKRAEESQSVARELEKLQKALEKFQVLRERLSFWTEGETGSLGKEERECRMCMQSGGNTP